MKSTEEILEIYKEGELSLDAAVALLKTASCFNLGHTRVDLDRSDRTGAAEVIYGAGKTVEQICEIASVLLEHGNNVLITRISEETAACISERFPESDHSPTARLLRIEPVLVEKTTSFVAVVSAGTSDLPVAEEAALTAEFLGSRVKRFYDCGVAGLHRLLSVLDEVREARVIVAVAGMEGALPSVLAGLVKSPVLAVPTSVGYGANLEGVTTLLAMLNSCANGISVVNIDNGFGAGYNAHLINSL